MSTLTDLIDKIDNQELRSRISQEVNRLTKQKKFGLVFEEHLPECTPLFDLKVKKGSTVAMRVIEGSNGKLAIGPLNDTYTVLDIDGNKAVCVHDSDKKQTAINLDNLVCVAKFGDPIYPYLKQLDAICNAPDSKLWHTLIEADNYHALQLLVYLYGGMVDCIYVDPPYNTGATDWKYNNDYIDGNDCYRHSKWLSMMQRRLKLAKQLLNPKCSVLIVTIDEKEYLHLGCLLEEMFPEARIQMISTVIKPEGTNRANEFSRTNEYIFFLLFGSMTLTPSSTNMFELETQDNDTDSLYEIEWRNLRRREASSTRSARPNQFYPIFISKKTGYIHSIGDALPYEVDRNTVTIPKDCYALFPLTPSGEERLWGKHYQTARILLKEGYLKVDNGLSPDKAVVKYLPEGIVNDINDGKIIVSGRGSQNEVIAKYVSADRELMPKTMWYLPSHNAQTGGSLLIKKVIGENRFSFPKSLYAVRDTIRFFIANKPNALVVDFFAGSGTTMHAVNLLNAEDGGNRRCILVTNNEMSKDESDELLSKGLKPGDDKWVERGIARYTTWPRTVCSITGKNIKGQLIDGHYGAETEEFLVDDDSTIVSKKTGLPVKGKLYKKIKRQLYPKLAEMDMSDGFKANAVFFHLGFLDKNAVALGRQFKELVPLLWMKAGAIGECPKLPLNQPLPKIMVCSENKFAVLIDELYYKEFTEELDKHSEIDTVYIVTDSESGYREMATHLNVEKSYQLYRDYLDNFRINKAAR